MTQFEDTDLTAPEIIAHRGFAGVAPENSLAAFRAVADGTHPAAMIEMDVMPCADGTPVVFHDLRLDDGGNARGITDGEGVVWETSLEEIQSARILDTDQQVPTLREALDAIPPEVGVNVELKNPGSFDVRPGEALEPEGVDTRRDRWDPFVESVLAELEDENHELLISSFCEPALASVRDLAPEIPVASLVSHSLEDGLRVAERYECEAIHPPVDAIRETPFFDPPGGERELDLLAAAADLGCAVNVWTVCTWREAYWLQEVGVDGVIADYPRLFEWDRE